MPSASPIDPPFVRLGPADAMTPVVIAVPHAGRFYPPELIAAARLPRRALETIEDRYADLLIADAVLAGAVAIVARLARAYVDLNRDPREIDLSIVRAGDTIETRPSAKASGGLGAVPSRIAAGGAVWKRPLAASDIAHRIAAVHDPYHRAIADALDDAVACHGYAILVDCHSMPPLGAGEARFVVGDLYGDSADAWVTGAAIAALGGPGRPVARNRPYAGGFTLARHGDPGRGRHAIQIEFDRALYLDRRLGAPGPGLDGTRRLLAGVAAATGAAAPGLAEAAE